MPEPLIELRNLGKHYGSFVAVRNVNLTIGAGEIFGLLGPNGAGKTTTISMMMGVLQPSEGEARMAGFDCFSQRAEVMRQVGYVPDEPAFQDYLRGRELIRFVGTMRGLSRAEIAGRAGELLEKLDLAREIDDYAVNYSRGMKKKLALLLALLHEPRVLVLDEPTNGLDPYATRTMHELMRTLRERGSTVLFSTHLLDQAQRLCTRVAILHKGSVVTTGTVGELGVPDRSLEDLFFELTGGAYPGDERLGPGDQSVA